MTHISERERNLEEDLKNRETWLIILNLAAASIVTVAGPLGNIIFCLAIYKVRAHRKIQNYYIVALSISDLLLILLSVPPTLIALFLGRWPFGDTICQIQGNIIFLFVSCSLLNLTLIAINRYVKVVRSVNTYQKMYSKNNVLLSIGVSGILSAVFPIPFNLSKFCFHPGLVTCFPCKNKDTKEQALLLVCNSALFAITVPVLILCYYKVFRKVRTHFAQIADSTLNQAALKSFAEEVKITKTLFAVLITFLICWSPAVAVVILETLPGDISIPRQVHLIVSFTTALNAVFNPVIYGLMQKRFRDAYKEILTCTRN